MCLLHKAYFCKLKDDPELDHGNSLTKCVIFVPVDPPCKLKRVSEGNHLTHHIFSSCNMKMIANPCGGGAFPRC